MARSAIAGLEATEITFSSFRDSGNRPPSQLLHMASSKHCRKRKATDSIARCDASAQLCLNVTPGVDAFPVAIVFVDCVLGKWVDFGSKNGGVSHRPTRHHCGRYAWPPTTAPPPASRFQSLTQFINSSQLNTTQNDSSMGISERRMKPNKTS